ncbi:MAG: sugar phosphate isomerase/epimerase family protein [Halanaeroarchaeum sp.]
MGLGYTTIMYDRESIREGLQEISACRYDGVEIGLEKVRYNGADTVAAWTDEYDLDLYCVMCDWVETEDAFEDVLDGVEEVAGLDVPYMGILPPQRNRHDEETAEERVRAVADAIVDAGSTPLLHHHGATVIEQPDEIEHYLDVVPEAELIFDTAHYYPYGANYPDGDVTDGIERFADDIAYVHLKDVAPGTDFAHHRDGLSAGDFHLDNVINYFRTFTDLGEGILDFEAVYDALEDVGYDGHYTVEIENQTMKTLLHAKENYDYWTALTE